MTGTGEPNVSADSRPGPIGAAGLPLGAAWIWRANTAPHLTSAKEQIFAYDDAAHGICKYDGRTISVAGTCEQGDVETGLDFFGARYYAGAQGRFTSPDPLMASAKASNPQTWNRYAYALNNPLRYVDPDGMEVPEECAKDPRCTIQVKVNIIYDQTVNRGQGLSAKQLAEFKKEQLAKAQKEFGTSNIKLSVNETYGRYDVGPDGVTLNITGLKSDSLNLVVSNGTPTNTAGVSYLDPATRDPITILSINDAVSTNLFYPFVTNTTEHERVHQFLGDPFTQRAQGIKGYIQAGAREAVVDSGSRQAVVDTIVKGQSLGISQQSIRKGLEPRRYAAPVNPEANKPRQ